MSRVIFTITGVMLAAAGASIGALAWQGTVAAASQRGAPPVDVTFAEHVAPIIFRECAGCHRPGEAAPFPLTTYEDVVRRGPRIAAVTKARSMPPWKAAPASFPYRDERRLSDEQIATIEEWVAQGMPSGDLSLMPPPPEFQSGWQLGAPDLVLEMPAAFEVPATGHDVYRNFVIPLGLAEDRWIRAIELRPSARQAVHHVLYFAVPSEASGGADAADPEPGFTGMRPGGLQTVALGGWALGQQPQRYPDGLALMLPRGSDLVLQYHFHPTGKPETERSVIGLHFAERAPDRRLMGIQLPPLFGFLAGIDIPAGARDFRVEDAFELPVDVEGVVIGAHAHYRGREMKMTATLPDGREQLLLWIPDWDFAWQDRYFFNELVPLPKGTRLKASIRWDNSADNPRNPSKPPVRVTWGEQSMDEMGSITLQVVPRRAEDFATLQTAYRRHVAQALLKGRR